jgi:phosphotransferase system enzyme I (PtsI)
MTSTSPATGNSPGGSASQIQGVGVCPGLVIGTSLRMPPPIAEPADHARDEAVDLDTATAALDSATRNVADQLKGRAAEASGDAKGVLEATALMATDSTLRKGAIKRLEKGKTAERAFFESAGEVIDMFAALGGKMAERQRDVHDVRDRVIAQLQGLTPPGIPSHDKPFVLLADDLAPADTATLDPQQVLALVTAEGGPQSHTAIIARSLNLPAVVAATGVLDVEDGTEVFVNGAAGTLSTEVSDADRESAATYRERMAQIASFDGDGRLSDGTSAPLLANVGNGADARAAAEAGAQGIGLFRTEFLFFERTAEPSQEEQVAAYAEVFEAFSSAGSVSAPAKVVLRTLDAGADKPLPFLTDTDEPNPALGVRGYRTEVRTPGVLRRQLDAVAEAARSVADKPVEVWVMAPMIATAAEARDFRVLCEEAGLSAANAKIGVMIEIPAAALAAQAITAEVDFVSIGTNDLTQYTMAADRQLGALAELNDPWQPGVLHLIRATGSGSQGPVGVCGEAAADPLLAPVLLGLGVNTLSMSASALPRVAAVLRGVTAEQVEAAAQAALSASSPTEARAAAVEQLPIVAELGLG